MRRILVLGAGRSSASLIKYLLEHADSGNWTVIVGDVFEEAARKAVAGSLSGKAILFNIEHDEASRAAVINCDVVISLLPPHFHPAVARLCLALGKHLLTASYVTDEMKRYHSEAVASGLLFLNECGLDPGLDHMSAMRVIDKIRSDGGEVRAFQSFTGGLVDPATDAGNPWKYRFTWNPRNVVMAGQGTAKYLLNGTFRYIPYQRLFLETTSINVPGAGEFEGYANRNSLPYIATYGLDGVETMLRGTLRHTGFCEAWNVLVQLGCCDDSYNMDRVETMTHAQFIASFMAGGDVDPKMNIASRFGLSRDVISKLEWSGFFSNERVGLSEGSPARITEAILQKKWKLEPGNLDLVVMQHRFVFEADGSRRKMTSSFVCRGENQTFTAMARTVGLPLAIAARLLLEGKIQARGVVIPISAEFYGPILDELVSEGIVFNDEVETT